MLRLGRADDADGPDAPPARAGGRTSRMPLYIAATLLLVFASDLLILLLRA